jgi:hypothetical protein
MYKKLQISLLLSPIIFCLSHAQAQGLNFYYGNLHAHSAYSDGNKDALTSLASTPYHDFVFAKTAQHFDFLGISEHNHSLAGMVLADYARGLQQADSANQNGSFVAMYGIEWGVIGPPGGHVLIYGCNQLIGWDTLMGIPNYDVYNAKLDYNGLFTKIARIPDAFVCLAHPASSDYSNLFSSSVNTTYDSAIVATAIRSGPAFSTDTLYSNPSTSSYESRYKDALKQGYHLGAILDHDNHYTTFGKTANSRTVVLAPSLSRADIMTAIKQRKTQSSDDWNVQVTFQINNAPLGSIVTDTASPRITVTVYDPDLETTASIVITYGIPGSGLNPTSLTSSTTGSINYLHSIPTGSSYYYYAVVTQADGDKIFTAPIWVNKVSVLPVKLISFTSSKQDGNIGLHWQTASEWNADYFSIERSNDAKLFESIGKVQATNSNTLTAYYFIDNQPFVGTVYYRLKQVDMDGTPHFSNIIWVHDSKSIDAVSVLFSPNPFNHNLTLAIENVTNEEVVVNGFNTMGQKVFSQKMEYESGQELTIELPSELTKGMYTFQVTVAGKSFAKHVFKY